MSNERTEIIPYREFIKRSKKPVVGSAIWRWEDIYPKLMDEPSSAVSLVNKETENAGISQI